MAGRVREAAPTGLSRGLGAFLRLYRGKVLVLIAQDLAHWYVGEIAASANQIAQANGYHLISLDFHRSAEREHELLTAVSEAQVEGYIFLWDYFPQNLPLYQHLAAHHPCIQIGDPKPIPNLDHITGDDYSGGMSAMRHLLHLGYQQIGHITLRTSLQAVRERRQAFEDALNQANLRVCDNWLLELSYGFTEASRTERLPEIRKFLSQPELPRAFFVCADWLAVEVIECIQELGLRIPEDIAIVGYDDALPYALTSTPLTTVRVDLQQLGRLAVERLLFRIHNGPQTEPCQLCVPPMLVVRASSAQITPTTERWSFAKRYIQEHFREELTAQQVAKLLGFNSNYFSHQFRQVFGQRFTDYVHQLRLAYASELLLTTDYTINRIAELAGFQSLNHFYTLFKRHYQLSPHLYRSQHFDKKT